jgi:hypothetical protein
LEGYRLELSIDDGISGTVDLSDLAGKGVFAIWSNRPVFEKVCIGSSGELAWGGSVNLCPDSLYLKVTNKKPQDLFPALRPEPAHA